MTAGSYVVNRRRDLSFAPPFLASAAVSTT
jgi:hypothetical protein